MNKNGYLKVNGVVFPITYLDNGMMIMDYPDREPRPENPEHEEKLKKIHADIQELIKKYDIKLGFKNEFV